MCIWDEKPRLTWRPKRFPITAYKRVVFERYGYSHDGRPVFFSPDYHRPWHNLEMSGKVPMWSGGYRSGVYCLKDPKIELYTANPKAVTVKVKIWGKIHNHKWESYLAPTGYRASHAKIVEVLAYEYGRFPPLIFPSQRPSLEGRKWVSVDEFIESARVTTHLEKAQ